MLNKLTPRRLESFKYSIGGNDFNKYITLATYKVLSRFYYGKTCLELGCADGFGTHQLLKFFQKVTAIDGSKVMLKKLKKKISSKKLTVIHSMIEDLEIEEKFDTIILAHTIDIVDDPVEILKKVRKFCHKKTRILIEVPNSHSLHRQTGVMMGLLKNEHSIREKDNIGHQRIYDLERLEKDIREADLKIFHRGGFLLKPFPNKTMYKIIKENPKLFQAYLKLGEEYKDIAAEIYAACGV